MISIPIDLWPYGRENKGFAIARLFIANKGLAYHHDRSDDAPFDENAYEALRGIYVYEAALILQEQIRYVRIRQERKGVFSLMAQVMQAHEAEEWIDDPSALMAQRAADHQAKVARSIAIGNGLSKTTNADAA